LRRSQSCINFVASQTRYKLIYQSKTQYMKTQIQDWTVIIPGDESTLPPTMTLIWVTFLDQSAGLRSVELCSVKMENGRPCYKSKYYDQIEKIAVAWMPILPPPVPCMVPVEPVTFFVTLQSFTGHYLHSKTYKATTGSSLVSVCTGFNTNAKPTLAAADTPVKIGEVLLFEDGSKLQVTSVDLAYYEDK
jgi:hypothetical protein